MDFIKTVVKPEGVYGEAYYFCFSENNVLVREESGSVVIPTMQDDCVESLHLKNLCFFGMYQNCACYCAQIDSENIPNGYKLINLREYYLERNNALCSIAGYARQINDWNIDFKYCGRCGTGTQVLEDEHARKCGACGLLSYPRVSPAVIVAVVRDNKILLARNSKYSNQKMFSVLAGFVEVGESLEECVQREIFEEVGIRVKDLSYFKSQTWPFPDSLMIGFTAVYGSGEIVLDDKEIIEAKWFGADELPLVPKSKTLSGELIKWFVNKN